MLLLKPPCKGKYPGILPCVFRQEKAADAFLSRIPYELVYTPKQPTLGLFEIRDPDDYAVLYSAIAEDVDIFITGDKDFENLNLDKPEILTPSQFLAR